MTEEEKFWKGLEELKKRQEHIDEEIEKLTKNVNRVTKNVDGITDGWGRWVEGSVSPSAVKTFSRLGYKIFADYHRRKVYQDRQVVREYNTLIVGEKEKRKFLFIGEAKSFFSSNDVKEFLDNLGDAKKYLKEFRGYQIIGFVAGMNYGEGADTFAIRSGLFVFKPSGEMMVLDVPKGFKPKIWE